MSNEVEHCTDCGKSLETPLWLELSFETGEWFLPGQCPEEESQGCFPFGSTCYKRKLKSVKR